MDRGRAILGPEGWETRRGSFATDFGTNVNIDTSSPNTNRLPSGENGPYVNTQTNTRPVPTAF